MQWAEMIPEIMTLFTKKRQQLQHCMVIYSGLKNELNVITINEEIYYSDDFSFEWLVLYKTKLFPDTNFVFYCKYFTTFIYVQHEQLQYVSYHIIYYTSNHITPRNDSFIITTWL